MPALANTTCFMTGIEVRDSERYLGGPDSKCEVKFETMQQAFFDQKKRSYCGFYTDDVEVTEMTIKGCCTDEVFIDSGFMYCQTNRNQTSWRECLIANTTLDDPQFVVCNARAQRNAAGRATASNWKVAGLALLSVGLTAVLNNGFF